MAANKKLLGSVGGNRLTQGSIQYLDVLFECVYCLGLCRFVIQFLESGQG